MVSFSILNSHPVGHLKKEISKTNIKGYSKMKKGEIIDLMLKYPDRFKHIRTYGEPVKKIVIKRELKKDSKYIKKYKEANATELKEYDIKPSMATKKIIIKRKPQQATVIKPKKREAKEADLLPSMATKKIVIKRKPQQAKIILPKEKKAAMKAKLINKKMTITKASGKVIELKKRAPRKVKTKIDSSKEIIHEFEDFPDILPSKATRKIQIKKKPLKAKVIKPKKRTALKAKVIKAQKEESSEEEEEEEEITLRKFKPISVIPKALKKIWFEYMGVRAGSYTKEDQNDEVEELERVENNFIQANSNRKNKNLSSSEQMKGVFTIGQIIPEVIKEINDNPDLIKLYKVFQPSIIKNVLDQRKKTAENAKKEEAALKKQEKEAKKEYEKSLKDNVAKKETKPKISKAQMIANLRNNNNEL